VGAGGGGEGVVETGGRGAPGKDWRPLDGAPPSEELEPTRDSGGNDATASTGAPLDDESGTLGGLRAPSSVWGGSRVDMKNFFLLLWWWLLLRRKNEEPTEKLNQFHKRAVECTIAPYNDRVRAENLQ
jgi:hypothetical protein